MLTRALATGLAAIVLSAWMPADAAAQFCQFCFECGGGEHENWSYPQSFTGNHDGAHECWFGGCDGFHDNTECENFAALEAVLESPTLDAPQVDVLVARFADHVVRHPSGKYLQVLDCKAERVIAQFAINAHAET